MFGWRKKRKPKDRPEDQYEGEIIRMEIEDCITLFESFTSAEGDYDFDKPEMLAFSVSLSVAAMNHASVDIRIINNFILQALQVMQGECGTPAHELAGMMNPYFAVLIEELRQGQTSQESTIFKDTVKLLAQSAIKQDDPHPSVTIGWLVKIAEHLSAKTDLFLRLRKYMRQ